MSDVLEQGRTRWARPSDYDGPIKPGKRTPNPPPGRYRPPSEQPKRKKYSPPGTPKTKPRPGQPGYKPRAPKAPSPGKGATPFPFRNPMKPGGGGVGRALGGIGIGIGAIDLLDGLFKNPDKWKVRGPWYLVNPWCPANSVRANVYWGLGTSRYGQYCLTGQSYSVNGLWGTPWPNPPGTATWKDLRMISRKNPPGAGGSFVFHKTWHRADDTVIGPGEGPVEVPVIPLPTPQGRPNPNTMRGAPTPRATPIPDPKPWEQSSPGGDGKGGQGDTAGAPPSYGVEFGPGGPRPIMPRPRVPPHKGEKERKVLSGSTKLRVALFKVLDQISETSELVDALFEALPQETIKKWDCTRATPFIDKGGQYGIENADCKAAALWHNWHKVDVSTAVENIIKNHIQDKVLGGIHSLLPKNIGHAVDDGIMGVDEWLSDLLDEYLNLDWID